MNRAPTVIAIAAAYVACAGSVLYLWLVSAGAPLPGYAPVVCALPLPFTLALSLSTRAPRERLLRSMVCLMFLPILLLLWGTSLDFTESSASPRPEAPAAGLRAEHIFAGAIARQDVPASAGMSFHSDGAAFADGSELRLLHFQSPREAANYLGMLQSSFQARELSLGGRRGHAARPSEQLLVYWELHGSSVLELRAANELLARVRMEAQHVPQPVAQERPIVRPVRSRRIWPFALGYALTHALGFVLFVVWAAAATTRVAAVFCSRADPRASTTGTQAVNEAELLGHIDALPALGARCSVAPGQSQHERIVDLRTHANPRRAHRLTVRIDEKHRLVRVFEREGASGAAPRDADEASMRALGDNAFDPTRPAAQKIWVSKIQTTFIEPARLAALPLTFEDGSARLPRSCAEALDADGVIHLVCALVTRSGFHYQPVFFGFQG